MAGELPKDKRPVVEALERELALAERYLTGVLVEGEAAR